MIIRFFIRVVSLTTSWLVSCLQEQWKR